MARKPNYIPYIGEKINSFTVVDNSENYINYSSGRRRVIKCQCICKKVKQIPLSKLVSNNPKNILKSCGCNTYYPGQPKNAYRNNPDSIYMELFRHCRQSSKKRKLKFNLTFELHKELVNKDCFYCGKPAEMRKRGNKVFFANGIDRVDSLIGYVEGNCVPSCSICNNMKWDFKQKLFFDHIKKIVEFNKLK